MPPRTTAIALLVITLATFLFSICPAWGRQPRLQVVHAHPFVFVSDHPFRQASDARSELLHLDECLVAELGIAHLAVPVRTYLFKDFHHYQDFVLHHMPYLERSDTMRHGIFLLRNKVPHIFAHCSDHLMATLRHEFVHVQLNTSCKRVPLWLDEGLASAHEPGRTDLWHDRYAELLAREIRKGWRPDLRRLESLKAMPELGPLEYAEAWSWVHWLLRGPPERRAVLSAYLADLRTPSNPVSLTARIKLSREHLKRAWLRHFGYPPETHDSFRSTVPRRFLNQAASWFGAR